ncbi:solute carrier family 35 member B1-like [Paramacrobiotus metropolitanus]|uniref:solute carrier family 35 member B1-like n=1 Tax=Paramacrobiotus metropolitanus TaxID=2943436 RepID=UPI0024456670|nr:solute carrier family 35 member B1-like [Paramacrobiotus metropolitanus]
MARPDVVTAESVAAGKGGRRAELAENGQAPLRSADQGAGDEVVVKSETKKPASTMPSHAQQHPSTLKLLGCAAGVFLSFFVFGIFQERITRGVYGENERFHYTLTLVFVQCVINAIFARLMIYLTREARDTTPRSLYGWCSLSYLAAMLSSNQALQYVNYPTQVLGKSCKPIPVMLFGVFFAHRRYAFKKYLFVLCIVVGVSIFFYESGKKHSKEEQKEIGFGEALLALSLFMDGVTGAVQDRMRTSHKTRPNNMMMWMNIFSSFLLLAAIVVTGELVEVLGFILRYPYVLEQLLTFAVCSAVGQFFIFLTVADFGPLPCSIITTTRKFFTILVSVLFFNNPISGLQWAATLLVFIGLILDVKYGKDRKH